MSGDAAPTKKTNEVARGFGKLVFGGLFAAGSIVAYPAFFGIGSTMAAIGASVTATGMLFDLPKYFKKGFDPKETNVIRQLGAAITTAGVASITAPGIGIALASEGLYSMRTGEPVSAVSSVYKNFNYIIGNDLRHITKLLSSEAPSLEDNSKIYQAVASRGKSNDPKADERSTTGFNALNRLESNNHSHDTIIIESPRHHTGESVNTAGKGKV